MTLLFFSKEKRQVREDGSWVRRQPSGDLTPSTFGPVKKRAGIGFARGRRREHDEKTPAEFRHARNAAGKEKRFPGSGLSFKERRPAAGFRQKREEGPQRAVPDLPRNPVVRAHDDAVALRDRSRR